MHPSGLQNSCNAFAKLLEHVRDVGYNIRRRNVNDAITPFGEPRSPPAAEKTRNR
jgi:hypothetical protein